MQQDALFHCGPMSAGINSQRFTCPDCAQPMRVTHTSPTASPLLREKYYQCTNVPNCGSSFKGSEEITERISVAPKTNQQIDLPIMGEGHNNED